MFCLLKVLIITTLIGVSNVAIVSAQGAVTSSKAQDRDPNVCGAAGAGCDPADVQQWKAIGDRLADLSSADLSQYAYACAQHNDWKEECETDPIAVLKRLGIDGY